MVTFWHSSAATLILRIFVLALLYVISGRLSLLLAIPPGFVSGLFLPMGIALGVVLIWGFPMLIGVFLGSVLLNISINPAAEISLSVLSIAACIASGSVLASAAGTLLIRRFIGFPNDLTGERNIFLFFILGGPIATTLSASVGVLTLFLYDIIPLKNVFYSWWTWWIGDAIGVLIATPLVCVLFAEPRHFWRGRRLTVGVPLVLSSLVTVAVFIVASHNEEKKLNGQFRQEAGLISLAVEAKLESIAHTLATLRGLFVASDYVSATEFADFISYVVIQKESVNGFSWNQRVPHQDRNEFENKMIEAGHKNFSIKEKNAAGEFVPAQVRDEYVVITYIEPLQKNVAIVGFDVASDLVRELALSHARDSGAFALTPPLQLLQDNTPAVGVVGYLPVYERGRSIKTVSDRRKWLKGYATAIARTDHLVNTALLPFPLNDYHVNIVDKTEEQSVKDFYHMDDQKIPAYAQALILHKEVWVGERRLLISISPTEKYLADHISLQSWFVLAGGLLFCGLLGGFLLLISGRTQHIKNLVDQRTLELAAIFENAIESILVVNEIGVIQKANPAAAKLFKYPLIQFSHLDVATLIPALGNMFIHNADNKVASLREMTGVCSDGSTLEIELSLSPVVLHEKKLFTFIIHDATAKRKVDRMKTEFISTVSHELRTPLTSIKGSLSIVLNGNVGEVSEKVQSLLVIASRNVDRLSRLVSDILDVDKLEFGQVSLTIKRFSVVPLLEQAIQQSQGYAARYNVNLAIEVLPECALETYANIDGDRFSQVMANLISNAIKFSNSGGIVRVQLAIESEQLKISVIDQGQGISDNFRPHIFQKFAQADSSDTRHHEGSGLGLSITKAIVERMNGQIHYQSLMGKGSTFYILLPLAIDSVNKKSG